MKVKRYKVSNGLMILRSDVDWDKFNLQSIDVVLAEDYDALAALEAEVSRRDQQLKESVDHQGEYMRRIAALEAELAGKDRFVACAAGTHAYLSFLSTCPTCNAEIVIAKLTEARDLAAQASATLRDESIAKDERIANLMAALDAKNVRIGRLDDDVRRLTSAVEHRDITIKELRHDLANAQP